MYPTIYIFGDSWGSGEWNDHKISNKGLEELLTSLGYHVINHSQPAGSNINSFNKLKNVITKVTQNDYIFFITTDASRDIGPQSKDNLTKILEESKGLSLLIDNLLNTLYNNLNNLCISHGLKTYMIGGLNNLDTTIYQYANLLPIIPSWIDLLVGKFDDYINVSSSPKFRILSNPHFTINRVNLNKLNVSLAEKIIEDFYLYQEQNSLVFREEIFKPDGVHPNKDGHKILFDTIVEKLNL